MRLQIRQIGHWTDSDERERQRETDRNRDIRRVTD